jgi:hypothetical protein
VEISFLQPLSADNNQRRGPLCHSAIMQVTARISPIGAPIRITDPVKIESQMNQLAKAPLAESVAMEFQASSDPAAHPAHFHP